MMRLARRSSLIVLFFLVTAVSTASAECAWVLWQRDQTLRVQQVDEKWWLLEATQTFQECRTKARKGVEASVQIAKEQGHSYTVDETTVTSSNQGQTAMRLTSYLCLPDTVDPRGTKGSGR
jgi:hypothetical protein